MKRIECHSISKRWLQFGGTSKTVALAMEDEHGIRIRDSWNACLGLNLRPDTDLREVLLDAHTALISLAAGLSVDPLDEAFTASLHQKAQLILNILSQPTTDKP